MAGFVEAVAQARARTGKLGEKWPDTAKVIYSGMQLVLTGQAAPGRGDGQGGRLAGPMTRTSRRMSITRAARPAPAGDTVRPASARSSGRRGEAIAKILFVVPAGLAIVVLFGYPVVKNLVMSFQDYTLATFFTGEAPWVGLRNIVTVVGDDAVHQGVGQHRPVHRRIHRRTVRDRPGAGAVLPSELPPQPGRSRALPPAVADAVDRGQRRVAGDPRTGQRDPEHHAAAHRHHRLARSRGWLRRMSHWSR